MKIYLGKPTYSFLEQLEFDCWRSIENDSRGHHAVVDIIDDGDNQSSGLCCDVGDTIGRSFNQYRY